MQAFCDNLKFLRLLTYELQQKSKIDLINNLCAVNISVFLS